MLIRSLIVTLFVLLLSFPAAAKNITVSLGSKTVTLKVTGTGGGPACVALHSNEQSAIKAVAGLCGKLIVLQNGGARDLSFKLGGVSYRFDPNRIFTSHGLSQTLKPKGNREATAAVAKLATVIKQEIGHFPLVGLHTNRDGGYSIRSYLSGGEEAHAASRASASEKDDPDNFILTTNPVYFQKAVALGYSAVLESGRKDDGSLSVYARSRGRSYLNIEAQSGNTAWQRQAYQALLR